ncbi:His-Xaa-Ser system protein HxsD [Mesorhizobium sp. M0041]|uniref:His-Xaa-Ser system protein HxsD n=1 Tax=Mesorhizobium sp. M0041 TaxID=2956856 RepID=UPI003337F04F
MSDTSRDSELVQTTQVKFDLSVFSLDCVKRAAYRVTGNAAVEITIEGGFAVCTINFSKAAARTSADAAVERLRLEVLDQDLRSSIAAETATVRKAILALAFSKSGLQSDD